MLLKKIPGLLIAAAILPCFIQPASAHVIWFEKENAQYNLLFGHPEEGPQFYDVKKFTGAEVYDINKQTIPFSINQTSDQLYLTADKEVAAITASLDNGYVAEVGDDAYYDITASEVGNYQNVRHLLKYTKALYNWSDALAQSFDLPLEILPLQNPFAEDLSGSLLVQILAQGKPVSDSVTVEYLGQEVAKNADGTFSIPIGTQGLVQAIEASYSISAGGITTSYETGFTAQIASVPEPSALLGLSVVGLLALRRKKILLNK